MASAAERLYDLRRWIPYRLTAGSMQCSSLIPYRLAAGSIRRYALIPCVEHTGDPKRVNRAEYNIIEERLCILPKRSERFCAKRL